MYTSGRTVKSIAAKRSPISQATADARKLVRKHLPAHVRPTVDSSYCTGLDLVTRMKTVITFAEMSADATKPLADAVADLPRYHSMCWNIVSISYLREI
jgi:hypothetical protein